MTGGSVTRYAPSFRLVSACFAAGLAGQIVFTVVLALRAGDLGGHFFQAPLLGLVHLCVLGWLLPITVGALHQLVPVVFEAPLASEKAVWAGMALYLPGAIELVWRFDRFDVYRAPFPVAAGLLTTAVLVWVANLAVTIWRAPTRSLTGAHVIAALAWLVVAVGLGFTLALNLYRPFLQGDHLLALRAHAHAAGLGFFGLLIMGVAYRLLEMFLLAVVRETGPGRVSLWAVNGAVLALVGGFLLDVAALRLAGVAAAGVGVVAFLVQVRRLVRARQRRALDVGFRHTAASFVYLAGAAVVGAALALAPLQPPWRERLALAYGLLALPGFVGSVIVGQLYKILPFLVWLHRFSAYVGLMRVPAASDLLPQRPQRAQWLLMHAGMVLLLGGILAGVAAARASGAALLVASALLFTRNMVVIWRRRPT